MKIIQRPHEFSEVIDKVDRLVDSSTSLPNYVFKEGFKTFLFLTFDEIFLKMFYERIVKFNDKNNDRSWWIAVLDPDPVSYFYENFKSYACVEFSRGDDSKVFVEALNFSPGGSSPDAIIHNSNSLAVLSEAGDWVIFGDRDSEIAVCAFKDKKKGEIFEVIYGDELLGDVKEAADFAYGERSQYKDKLINSYGSM